MTPGGRTKNRDLTPFLLQRGDEGGWTHQRLAQPDDAFNRRCLRASVGLRVIYADIPELMG